MQSLQFKTIKTEIETLLKKFLTLAEMKSVKKTLAKQMLLVCWTGVYSVWSMMPQITFF